MWYGQHREDERIARLLGDGDISRSFFYELGANSPHVDSVSKHFYDMGARGVSIEPVRYWWKQLCENRTHNVNLHCAVGEFYEESRTIYVGAGTGLSTLITGHDFGPYESYTEQIKVRTLAEIYEKYPCHPDRWFAFAVIDCEGWEGPIIRGADWERFRPRVLCIESDKGYDWEPMLLAQDYRFVESDPANRFFVDGKR